MKLPVKKFMGLLFFAQQFRQKRNAIALLKLKSSQLRQGGKYIPES
jgi:hypothetical protein